MSTQDATAAAAPDQPDKDKDRKWSDSQIEDTKPSALAVAGAETREGGKSPWAVLLTNKRALLIILAVQVSVLARFWTPANSCLLEQRDICRTGVLPARHRPRSTGLRQAVRDHRSR